MQNGTVIKSVYGMSVVGRLPSISVIKISVMALLARGRGGRDC